MLRRVASRVGIAHGPIATEVGRAVLAIDGGASEGEGPEHPEGELAASDGEVISHLQKWLHAKYAIDVAYRSFSDRIRGPWRDALVQHWGEHAAEERKAAYDLAMRLVGMGADPAVTTVQVPACTPTPEAMMATLMRMELEAISRGREMVRMAGGRQSLRVLAENFILVDTQHLDDLRRLFPSVNG